MVKVPCKKGRHRVAVRQPVGSFLSPKPVQVRQVGTSKILSRNAMVPSGRAGVGGELAGEMRKWVMQIPQQNTQVSPVVYLPLALRWCSVS